MRDTVSIFGKFMNILYIYMAYKSWFKSQQLNIKNLGTVKTKVNMFS